MTPKGPIRSKTKIFRIVGDQKVDYTRYSGGKKEKKLAFC